MVRGHGRGCVLGSEGGDEETGAVGDGDGGGVVGHGQAGGKSVPCECTVLDRVCKELFSRGKKKEFFFFRRRTLADDIERQGVFGVPFEPSKPGFLRVVGVEFLLEIVMVVFHGPQLH